MKYPFPRNTVVIPLLLIISIWGVFILQLIGLGQNTCYGIVPRHLSGLKGVLLAPLFHSGWEHLLSNSVPIVVLSFLAVLLYQRIAYYVLFFGWIITGLLIWLFADFPLWNEHSSCHIGASGIVYLLASFIFFSGIIRKTPSLIAVSLIVVFLYGGMIWGIFPESFFPKNSYQASNPISWESHLFGGVTGLFFAIMFKDYGPKKEKYPWEDENYVDPKSEKLWQDYLETISTETEEDSTKGKAGEDKGDHQNKA